MTTKDLLEKVVEIARENLDVQSVYFQHKINMEEPRINNEEWCITIFYKEKEYEINFSIYLRDYFDNISLELLLARVRAVVEEKAIVGKTKEIKVE